MSRRSALLLAPATLTLVVLFTAALVGAVRTSLRPPGGLGGPSLASWRALFTDPFFVPVVRFTLQVTLLATGTAALLAVVVALGLRRYGTLARSLFALPVPIPHLVVATVAVLWLAPGGLVDRAVGELPLQLVGGQLGLGVVLVYVYKEVPFLTLLLLAVMGHDLRQREEAAAVFGAGRWQRLRWVVWPVIRGPLVVGSVIIAAFVLGSFEVPLVVGPTTPTTIAAFAFQVRRNNLLLGQGESAAALLLAAGMAIVLAVVAVRFARSEENA